MRKIAAHLEININEAVFPSLVEAASFASMKAQADALVPERMLNFGKVTRSFLQKGKRSMAGSVER